MVALSGLGPRGRGINALAFVCAFILLFALAAAPAAAEGARFFLPEPRPGDYVVWRDRTWSNPTWVGFLYYGNGAYGAVAVTPSTGASVGVLFNTETKDGKLDLVGQKVMSPLRSETDVLLVNYLMTLLPRAYGWRARAVADATPDKPSSLTGSVTRSSLLPPTGAVSDDLAEFGGAITVRFAPEVPVFGLRSIEGTDGKPILELERAGRTSDGSALAFYMFTPAPAAKAGVGLTLDPARKGAPVAIDGLSIPIDSQWSAVADNTFFLGSAAMLVVDSIDLAAAGLDRASLTLALVRRFSISSDGSWAIPSELSVTGSRDRFLVSNLFHDAETGTLNRDLKLCVVLPGGKRCAVVSLTVSETAYRTSAEYFDAILRSVSK